MTTIVIDANCFSYYVEDLVERPPSDDEGIQPSLYQHSFEAIFGSLKILMNEIIRHEWISSSKKYEEFAQEALNAMLLQDQARLLPNAHDAKVHRALRQLGMPSADARYVSFAAKNGCQRVMSEDIDFYEPKSKGCSEQERQKLVFGGHGGLPSQIRKTFGISIFPPVRLGVHL